MNGMPITSQANHPLAAQGEPKLELIDGVSLSFDPSDAYFGKPTHLKRGTGRWHKIARARRWSFRFSITIISVLILVHLFLFWPTDLHSGSIFIEGQYRNSLLKSLKFLAFVLIALLISHKVLNRWIDRKMSNSGRIDTDYFHLPVSTNSLARASGHVECGLNGNSTSQITSGKISMSESQALIRRIQHSIKQDGVVYEHTVISTICIPASLSGEAAIIASSCIKGSMIDSLLVDVEGDSASTLPAPGSKDFQAALLTTWRQELLPFESEPWSDSNWLTLMSAVCSDSPVSADSRALLWDQESKSFRMLKENPTLRTTLENESHRMISAGAPPTSVVALIAAIENLAKINVFWCMVRSKDENKESDLNLRAEVFFRTHLDATAQSRYERIRIRLGLIPRGFTMPMPLALRCGSYHLDFATPEGMYLYDTSIRVEAAEIDHSRSAAPKAGLAANLDSHVLSGKYGRTNPVLKTSRTGSGFAHVYCRGIGEIELQRAGGGLDRHRIVPSVSFEFREIPPGNLLWAVLLAGYLFGLAWFVGTSFNSVFLPGEAMKPIWNTVLFGLPAVLAGLVVAKFTSGQIQTVSLFTFGAIVGTVIDALLLIVTAALVSMDKWRWTWGIEWPAQFDLISVPWAIVMVITGTNLFLIAAMMLLRNGRYMKSLRV